ncbi:hypothetical protein [Pelosinus sp. sgz500959]|uniref:hypothetical protein n=1 Tax=Pelosinus sp. sgz500959 TaxID=3242472 RepID=UPI0036718A50
MKKYFITYSNELYSETREFCLKMARKMGRFDEVIRFTPEDIDPKFTTENSVILSVRNGNGLWLWKPYFIHKILCTIENGDVLVYCDAGSFFIKSSKYIIDSMSNEDIWVSDIPLIEKQFTNPSLFRIMNCDSDEYKETNQIQANFIAVRKSEVSMRFVKEWLNYCKQPACIVPEENVSVDGFQFMGHRSDQSILSLLSKKYGLHPHLDPTQYGRIPEKYYAKYRIFNKSEHNKEYSTLIILHRTKNVDKKVVLNQWLCSWLPLWLVGLMSKPVNQIRKERNEEAYGCCNKCQ